MFLAVNKSGINTCFQLPSTFFVFALIVYVTHPRNVALNRTLRAVAQRLSMQPPWSHDDRHRGHRF